ncbi:MAG: phosphate ABC transporter substrate-binding protein PstS [Actinomycetota bacterium]
MGRRTQRVKRYLILVAVVTALAVLAVGCGNTSKVDNTPKAGESIAGAKDSICGKGVSATEAKPSGIKKLGGAASSLSGAGATFPAPIYSLWAGEFNKAQGVQVAYQPIGSGGGIQQISAQTVDFGATDAPMKEEEMKAAKGGEVLHIPTVLGAVVVTYRLAGHSSGLKFTGELLGKIFVGKITAWNDPQIAAANPGVSLPSTPIAVVHRSDGSGTTAVFTDYLTKASPTWVGALGSGRSQGKEVAWPVGIGGKGNDGVSGAVGQTEGAIGYVELTYAIQQNLAIGLVQNRAQKFIQPCVETVTAAAEGFPFPADLRFSLTDGAGENAYPISSATWLLVYSKQTDIARAKALVNFLVWAMDYGQKSAPSLDYAPLSSDLRDLAIKQIRKIEVDGTPLVG